MGSYRDKGWYDVERWVRRYANARCKNGPVFAVCVSRLRFSGVSVGRRASSSLNADGRGIHEFDGNEVCAD
jgi:hypothetical protein